MIKSAVVYSIFFEGKKVFGVLLVGTGGFIGAACRYLLTLGVISLLKAPIFPYGTMLVNVLGCLLIGMLTAYNETRHFISPQLSLFLMVGFLGGFTTFSSFGLQAFELMKHNHMVAALIDVAVQAGLGLLAVWVGYLIVQS